MSLLAADFDPVAKIVIFAAIAIAAIVQRILKDKAAQKRTEIPRPDVDASAPRRHEEPARHGQGHVHRHGPHAPGRAAPRPPSPPRPAAAPEPATSHRAPGALGGLPAPSAAEPRGRLTDFDTTRLHFGAESHAHTAAALARRSSVVTGRVLLFGRDLTPQDRMRSAFLWHEILDPPPSISEPR